MSVADLFISGIVPGILFGVGMMVICWRHARRTGIDVGGARPSGREVLKSFLESLPALLLPGIILGGIFLGVFTPTESAAVAVVYALLIGLFLYRDLRWSQLPKILADSFVTSATVLLVVSAATVLSWIITFESVPQDLMALISRFASGKIGFLLLVNLFLLVLGILLEPPPALLIAVPAVADPSLVATSTVTGVADATLRRTVTAAVPASVTLAVLEVKPTVGTTSPPA